MKAIPFVPFKTNIALKFSKPFIWIADKIVKTMPSLEKNLIEAEIPLKSREYVSIAIFSSLYWFLILFTILNLISIILNASFTYISFIISLLISLIALFYIIFYPNYRISKKNKDIERNLVFAIRHLYLEVKSGVPLFEGLISVSKENYGFISKELEKCVKEISAGKDQINVFEELAIRTSHPTFKKVIWQITNAMKTGADLGKILGIIATELTQEQKVKIRKYGSQLSPYALMYLMLTIIVPTLGITLLVILSSFSGINIPQTFFYLILFVITIFQIMFLGLIKSQRPSVEI
ncbi:MAG: type II secretion system F family protein [Candidatus Aenigmatarchaeota archaeon]